MGKELIRLYTIIDEEPSEATAFLLQLSKDYVNKLDSLISIFSTPGSFFGLKKDINSEIFLQAIFLSFAFSTINFNNSSTRENGIHRVMELCGRLKIHYEDVQAIAAKEGDLRKVLNFYD